MDSNDIYESMVNVGDFNVGLICDQFLDALSSSGTESFDREKLGFIDSDDANGLLSETSVRVGEDGTIYTISRTFYEDELVYEIFYWWKGSLVDAIANDFRGSKEVVVNELQGNEMLSNEIIDYLNTK